MSHDTRYWDNANKIFHRKSNLFYIIGESLPDSAALQPTHGYQINTGAITGGMVNTIYRAVFLSGGDATHPATANVKSVGSTITPGTIAEGAFPGIPVTHDGTTRIEEVYVQYIIQSGDDLAAINTALAGAINLAVKGDPVGSNCMLRCTNPEANNAEISTGLKTKFNPASPSPVSPEVPCAAASGATLTISAKVGVAGNDYEFGFRILDKPPVPLVVNPNGVPKKAGIRHFGFTRAFKANFSGTEAEILADQAVPKIGSYLSAQAGSASFELVQNDDPNILPVIAGTAVQTNDSTRDFLIPAARSAQFTYALFFITPNALIDSAFDYLWLYRVRSSQLDLARELRNVSSIPVTAACDIFLNRSDILGHYGIAYSL
jgi:hypothetical protein